jgi:hypothetical protein
MTDRKSAKVILILVFVALLASPVVYKRLAARREAANVVRDTTDV